MSSISLPRGGSDLETAVTAVLRASCLGGGEDPPLLECLKRKQPPWSSSRSLAPPNRWRRDAPGHGPWITRSRARSRGAIGKLSYTAAQNPDAGDLTLQAQHHHSPNLPPCFICPWPQDYCPFPLSQAYGRDYRFVRGSPPNRQTDKMAIGDRPPLYTQYTPSVKAYMPPPCSSNPHPRGRPPDPGLRAAFRVPSFPGM